MKYLFLFFLLISNFSFGQNSGEFKPYFNGEFPPITLPKQFKQETRQTKQRFLRKEYNDTNSILCQGKLYAKDFDDFRSRYDTALYVHDFDIDGDYDILLFGRLSPGFENTDVYIFFKHGNEYIPQHLGNWITEMKTTRKSTEMVVLKTPCCADFQMEYMYYENNKEVRDSIRQYSHQIFYANFFDTTQPTKTDTLLHLPRGQKVIMAPDIDLEARQMYTEIGLDTEIGTITSDMESKAYYQFIYEGKTWYYIIVNATSEIILNEVWSYDGFGEINAARGWVCLE